MKRFLEEFLVDPIPDFLAHLLRLQDTRLAQQLEMVRHRRARECRDLHDLAHVETFAALEGEQDALAMLIAEGRECPRDGAPFARDRSQIIAIHNDILGYIVM